MSLGITAKKDETIHVFHKGEMLKITLLKHNSTSGKLGFTGPKSFAIVRPQRNSERIANLITKLKQEGNSDDSKPTTDRFKDKESRQH